MIQTENITINGRPLTRTYSDGGYYIQRDGVQYAEAIDPADSEPVGANLREPRRYAG